MRKLTRLVVASLSLVACAPAGDSADTGASEGQDLSLVCNPYTKVGCPRPGPFDVISNVTVQTPMPAFMQPASAVFTFDTSLAATATVAIAGGPSVSDAVAGTHHAITVGGLTQATTYSYTITSYTASATGTFRTSQTLIYNPNANKIRFVDASGHLIAAQSILPTPGAENVYFGPADLGALPNDCASDVTATFHRSPLGQSKYAEAHLFARDPSTYTSDLLALGDGDIKRGAWAEQTSQPLDLPSVQAIPYPASPTSTALWASAPLATSMFWPGGVDATNTQAVSAATCRHPSTGALDRAGAVKAVAVYQEGVCATSVALDTLLAQVTTGFYSSFATASHIDNPVNQYAVASSTLGVGNGQNDVRAGYVMAFHFSADVAGVGNEVWGMTQSRFGLDGQGVLSLDQNAITRLASTGIWSSEIESSVRSGLTNDLPARVHDSAQAQQMVSEPFFTECGAPTDCGGSADALASLITPSAAAQAGIANATEDQLQHLRCAVGSPAACAKVGRAATTNGWACAPSAADTAPVCQFVIPAKRMNAMPDELQLVWYDDVEVDNPAFALRVAGGATAQSRMCSAAPTSLGGVVAHYARGFAVAGKMPQ